MKLKHLQLALAAVTLPFLCATGSRAQTPPAPAAAAPAPAPIPFDEALLKAANDLLSSNQIPSANAAKTVLAIDPLIDGVTGAQSNATQSMERRIVDLVRKSYPKFEVERFSLATISRLPVVLIGTFTAINNAGVATGPRDAYRICLALIDMKTRKVISKGVARAKPEGIDVTPTPFFAEAPVWGRDAATDGYIKTCQGTKLGEAIDSGYADRILASALITDAIDSYNRKNYVEALRLYEASSNTPGGDQLRSLNGIYLSNWKLGRQKQAADAFGNVVQHGFASNKLFVRFLFKPGSTLFIADRKVAAPYPMWMKQIASRAPRNDTCLEIVGHTSPTGPEPLNIRLSTLRAEHVRDLLRAEAGDLATRSIANGVGSRENLVGTGRDNASDALDRRVEFKLIPNCLQPPSKI